MVMKHVKNDIFGTVDMANIHLVNIGLSRKKGN